MVLQSERPRQSWAISSRFLPDQVGTGTPVTRVVGKPSIEPMTGLTTKGNRLARLTPLSGILFVAFMVAVISFEGEELSDTASAATVLDYWADRADTRLLVASLSAAALLFLVVFAACLRGVLRGHESTEASASAVAFGGGVVAASGLSLSATLTLAASRAGDAGSAESAVTLNHLVQAAWLPITAGFAVMLLATGVGALRSGALPAVVSWIAVVLGVAFLTPAGIFAFMITPVWIIAVSVIAYRRQSPSRAMTPEPHHVG